MAERKKKEIVRPMFPGYEESYPYNVLYDILLTYENHEGYDEDGVRSAAEDLKLYDIWEFEKYMLSRLSDREMKCVEFKYRYNFTLDQTAKQFDVTRERIRQVLAKAMRKLTYGKNKCFRISREDHSMLIKQYSDLDQRYTKLLDYVLDTKELTETQVNDILERRVVSEALSDDEDISALDLSVRSYNCLKRHGIKTIKQLIDEDQKSEASEWIFKVRNLGRKSAKEIQERLLAYTGYCLKWWDPKEVK